MKSTLNRRQFLAFSSDFLGSFILKACGSNSDAAIQQVAVLFFDTFFIGVNGAIEWENIAFLRNLRKWQLNRLRITVEYINRRLKIFKMLSYPYRNRGKRYIFFHQKFAPKLKKPKLILKVISKLTITKSLTEAVIQYSSSHTCEVQRLSL